MDRRRFVSAVLAGIGVSLSGCSGRFPGQKTTTQREVRTPGMPECDEPPQDRITVVNRIPKPVVADVALHDDTSTRVFAEEISLEPDDEQNATSPIYKSDTIITEPGTYLVTVNVKAPYTLTHQSEREYTSDCDQWELLIKDEDVDDVRIPLEG